MAQSKLNIRYHNPNSDEEATVKYISRVFINAGRVKLESILKEAAAINNPPRNNEEGPV